MKKFVDEFKQFAMRGNVLDMAVGVIIGGAFGKIVTSLVEDIIMPLVSALLGTVSFTELTLTLGQGAGGAIEISYGMFIQSIVDFLIIAFSIFVFIKLINAHRSKDEPDKPPDEPAPTNEELLLTEIRDILKSK